MRTRLLLVSVMIGTVASAGLVHVPGAAAASFTCPPSPAAGSTIPGNLTVQSGAPCTLDNVTVTGNVNMNPGSELIAKNGTVITKNLNALNIKSLTMSGGRVDGNLSVSGTAGLGKTSFVCDVTIGKDVAVTRLGDGDEFDLGDDDSSHTCPTTGTNKGNTIGGSVSMTGNGSHDPEIEIELEVDLNTIGKDLAMDNNVGPMDATGNTIGKNFSCSGGTGSDGAPNVPHNDDGPANTVGKTRTCFPTGGYL